MKKNVIWRMAAAVHCTVCLLAMLLINAAAYIDPSVMTYAVSAIAGVVIACGAVFFVWWRKVKSKVSKTLGIDENAHKEVEEDVEIKDEDEN